MAHLLVLEPDDALRRRITNFFRGNGDVVTPAEGFPQAWEALDGNAFDVIIADVAVPGGSLAELLDTKAETNEAAYLIVTCTADKAAEAVHAVSSGAFDFLQKPFPIAELYVKVEKAVDTRRLAREAQSLRGERRLIYRTGDFVGQSPKIREVLDLVGKVARSNSSVVIRGETGTGKELIAGAIHYNSHRAKGAFVKVSCAALPVDLLENELFGHEKGAYTGADKLRIGRFEQADGGSILLDEIGDIGLVTQAKILRVLQERQFERLGSNRTISVDVRVISATNRNLEDKIKDGSFRDDLYYRLNVVTITLPPLRERREDIEPLARFFLRKFAGELTKAVKIIEPDAMKALVDYHWPGNIRELENAMERAAIMAEGESIGLHDLNLPFLSRAAGDDRQAVRLPAGGVSLEDVERELIVQALERTSYVQKDAAVLLRLSRRALNYKIQKHGLTHPSWDKNR